MMQNNRIQYLDLIRGGLILYVVFYHMSMQFGLISYESGNRPLLFSIMSFFMTSFYFFSGFLFSSKRSASDFVYNKVRKLLFPYVFWSVISLVVYYANRYILTSQHLFILLFLQGPWHQIHRYGSFLVFLVFLLYIIL